MSIKESHGYESAPSAPPVLLTLTPMNKPPHMDKPPHVVYTALAIAASIILILAIIVLVIRWRRCRRCQRNSEPHDRYHTRSGSASVRLRSGTNYWRVSTFASILLKSFSLSGLLHSIKDASANLNENWHRFFGIPLEFFGIGRLWPCFIINSTWVCLFPLCGYFWIK